jgi:hypothetical protein
MKHGFDMRRVFISGPGDLEREREAVRKAIADVNETDAMPRKVLLVSVGLMHDEHIVGYRAAVSENVRDSEFFIQVFEDDWGPKNLFRKIFHLAMECRDDRSMPMREIAVFLKDAQPETDPEIVGLRAELEQAQGIRVHHFNTAAQLSEQVREVAAVWVRNIVAESERVASA